MFQTLLRNILKKINPYNKFIIQLDINNKCNLNCIHCYHSHHEEYNALDIEDWFAIIDEIKKLLNKLHVEPQFVFCGGEPLLSKNLEKIINRINQLWNKPKIAILTNATFFPERYFDFLNPNQIIFQVSLDGSTDKTHDLIRGEGNFEKTIQNINLLINKKFDVSCLAVISEGNVNEIESFFTLAKQLKISSMNFERFVTQGSGLKLLKAGKNNPLEGLKLKEAFETILKYSKIHGVNTGTNKSLFCLIDEKLGHHNLVGLNGLVVDYMGNLKVTSRTDFIVGNILEVGLNNLYFKDKLLKQLRNGEIEECGSCKFYSKCGGSRNASYAKYKNFLKKDPGCWYIN